jgi:amino acid transporter
MASVFKRVLIGKPIASAEEHNQRLNKKVALPIFASDAISSTAYATQEILVVLLSLAGAGVAAYTRLVPIAAIVVVLLAIVVFSYRQTIFAYPSGGGAYVVSKDNLGAYPSLVAGGSLLVDYTLTVAVSVAGGVAAIVSAFPDLADYRVHLCVAFIVLMTVANLRGLRESGALFAPPTYVYIVSLVLLIVVGLYRVFVQDLGPIPHDDPYVKELLAGQGAIGAYFFLKAFSSGAVALSGVEAVSNGVPTFQRPESKNAARVLVMMAVILATTFFGLSVLSHHLQPVADEEGHVTSTVLAQLAEHVYGGRNILFFVTQFATFAILILAANTAFAGYPSLASIIAKDGYLPHQFANRGDRLVFSNSIVFLAATAVVLVIAFEGNVSKLIPLYAVGVFTGFTLSQTGMCVHHWRHRRERWRPHLAVNAVGAVTTLAVALVVVVVKFSSGAWVPAAIIPLLVLIFASIRRHYDRVKGAVQAEPGMRVPRRTHCVVVLVNGVNKGVLSAVGYARSLAPDRLFALSVVQDHEHEAELHRQWDAFDMPIELTTISSPYRELTRPIMEFLDDLDAEDPDDIITVVIPEFVTSLSTQWLHNQSGLAIKARLLYRPNTVVTSVPVHVD